jgi:hypothetical protein
LVGGKTTAKKHFGSVGGKITANSGLSREGKDDLLWDHCQNLAILLMESAAKLKKSGAK